MGGSDAVCVVDARDELGECPIWCPRENRLYWIDVTAPRLAWLDPATGERGRWILPRPVGSFALREGGGFLLAFRGGLAFFDPDTGAIDRLEGLADIGEGRFNDGKCDRRGRFWAGTMDRKLTRPVGKLFRVDPGPACTEMDDGIILANGIAWSPDDRVMYFTDTRAGAIYAYDHDLGAGTIANRRVFARTPRPDGCTVDSEGFLWSAEPHGWKLIRFAPDGRVDREVPVPVERPTSCIFGGPDLATLYVTSSTMGLDAGQLSAQPQAGGIFALDVGLRGLPEPRFAG